MLAAVPSTDIWTGGNLCPESPAPRDSMWTDGTANEETHFARVSGLEGERCCVKAGRRGWKGEPCSVLLYGVSYDFEDDIDPADWILCQVCEYLLETSTSLLNAPVNLSLTPGDPTTFNLSWSQSETGGGWRPTHWSVSACPSLSLAGKAFKESFKWQNKMGCLPFVSMERESFFLITDLSWLSSFK